MFPFRTYSRPRESLVPNPVAQDAYLVRVIKVLVDLPLELSGDHVVERKARRGVHRASSTRPACGQPIPRAQGGSARRPAASGGLEGVPSVPSGVAAANAALALQKGRAIPAGYVRIEAGTFTMGSDSHETGRIPRDERQHRVTLTRPFFLKTRPVTNAEWAAAFGDHPLHLGDPTHPVGQVTWYDALAYCNWQSAQEGLTPCYDLSACTGAPGKGTFAGPADIAFDRTADGYRLPTEAEWEYAARAGTAGPTYAVGTQRRSELAWFRDNSGYRPHPVGQKTPNAWGLYDMLGNVCEWVWDGYGLLDSEPTKDPVGAAAGSVRRCRGGGFGSYDRGVRTAYRSYENPATHRDDLGFRPARSVPRAP